MTHLSLHCTLVCHGTNCLQILNQQGKSTFGFTCRWLMQNPLCGKKRPECKCGYNTEVVYTATCKHAQPMTLCMLCTYERARNSKDTRLPLSTLRSHPRLRGMWFVSGIIWNTAMTPMAPKQWACLQQPNPHPLPTNSIRSLTSSYTGCLLQQIPF
jgi:hypothetical protein